MSHAPGPMRDLGQDLKYALRILARSPGFTLVAVLALAIGIGANITIYAVADALLIQPLPVTEPERVVRAYSHRQSNTKFPNYERFRDGSGSFTGLEAF